jgi:hypothetical protein
MRRLLLLPLFLLAWACGSNPLHTVGASPSAIASGITPSTQGTFSTRYVQGPNSCPNGDAPQVLLALVGGGGSVRLQWSEVGSIHTYLVESEFYPYTNIYQNELQTSTDTNFYKFLPVGGRHRFRVRTQSDCDELGPWTDYFYYSTDYDNDPHPIIVDPSPPPPGCGNDCPPPPCLVDCGPPPCLVNCGPPPPLVCDPGTHREGDICVSDPPPPPPPDPQTTFCHITITGNPPHQHTHEETLTLPLSAIYNGHIPQHPFDHLGACQEND